MIARRSRITTSVVEMQFLFCEYCFLINNTVNPMQDKHAVVFTGEGLREMRMANGLSLKEFWGSVGYTISRGSSYETSKTKIPEHVRRLVYLHHVLGVPTDPDTAEAREFAVELKAKHPLRLNNARKLAEKAVGLMQDTLSELKND